MTTPTLDVTLISEHASPLAVAAGVDASGQSLYVAHVARCLAAAGHRVEVLTRCNDPALPARVGMCPGVAVQHLRAGPAACVPMEKLLAHMPAFADAARQHFGRHGPADIVHASSFMSGWVGLMLRRRFGVPLVTTFHALALVRRDHQGTADTFAAERIAIEHALVRRSDRLIAACPQEETDLERLYGAEPERIRAVPCGVDTAEFRPGDRLRARARLGLAAHEFIVLQRGRLVPHQGIDNVIAAIARLPAGVPARLFVVGGDAAEPDERLTPEIGRLRRLAQTLGVGPRVHFTGRGERDPLRDWYVAADVFVTTPWHGPFGSTPLEAMACGTPVIGSAVGGILHTVADGVTGYHVPPRDPLALAQCLHRLHAQPGLAAALGRAGVSRVRSLFTWERVAAQLAEVYAELHAASTRPWPGGPVVGAGMSVSRAAAGGSAAHA